MRDPRLDMLAFGEAHVVVKPTHPDGPRKQQVLCVSTDITTGCNHPVEWHVGSATPAPGCDCCSWRQNDPGYRRPDRTPPLFAAPPGWSPEKWASMPRRERRAALRGRGRGL